MKNSAINNLTYTGIVTLSQYYGNKKVPIKQIKNSGGSSLFSFLSNCLIGDFTTAKFEMPTKIMLLRAEHGETPADTYYESASAFIYFLTKPEKINTEVNNSSTVCYSFVIPMDIITNTSFNSIGLYADMATELDAANFAAVCEIDDTSGMRSTSSALVIDWKLTIINNG